MVTNWSPYSADMNYNSMMWADSGRLCPADEEHDDFHLLLESPTALAAQYNFFSTHLNGEGLLHDDDPLRQSSILGSADFSQQLNMAGILDPTAQEQQHLTLPRAPSLELRRRLHPDAVQQASVPTQQGSGSRFAIPVAEPMPAGDTTWMQEAMQQQCEQQYTPPYIQYDLYVDPTVQLPAPTMLHRPAATVPFLPQQYEQRIVRVPVLQPWQLMTGTVRMPAAADLPVASAPRKKARLSSSVVRTVQVPVAFDQLPQVPVVTYALAPAQPAAEQLCSPDEKKQQQQEEQQAEPMQLRSRNKEQRQQQQQYHQQTPQLKLHVQSQSHDITPIALAPRSPTLLMADVVDAGAVLQPVGPAASAGPVVKRSGLSSVAHSVSNLDGLGKGSLVWAKFPRFPWWPAIIISDVPDAHSLGSHSTASSHSTISGGDAVHNMLVRFLGTYDAAWVEPKAVSPWGTSQAERAAKTKAAAFVKGLKEAAQYLESGALPDAFKEPPQLTAPQPSASTHKKSKQPTTPQAASAHAATAGLQLQQPDVWSPSPVTTPFAAVGSSPVSPTASHAAAAAALAAGLHAGRQRAGVSSSYGPSSVAHSSSTTATTDASKSAPHKEPAGGKKRSTSQQDAAIRSSKRVKVHR